MMNFSVEVVISESTRNYTFWASLQSLDLQHYSHVVVVDIAFSFRHPGVSLNELLRVVDSNPTRHFAVVDHHPLLKPSRSRPNLQLVEVGSAYECCVGSPNWDLMFLAALCEKERFTRRVASDQEVQRALGVRRAAADRKGVAGQLLMDRLEHRDWSFFEALAEEPREYHRNVRGRRVGTSLPSPILETALALCDPLRSKLRPGLSA
jgi:hypothetical protein